jgi:hypothetical protein
MSLNPSKLKTSFEVFAKGGKGNRQKRYTLMFDTATDCFKVHRGASATPDSQFLGCQLPEQH